MTNKMITGTVVRLGTEDYIVPALSLGQLQLHEADLNILATIQGGRLKAEQNTAVLAVLQAALSRNYSAITVEQLAEMVDLNNLTTVVKSVLGISGLLKDPNDPPAVAGSL